MFGTLNPVGMVLGTLWILAPYIAWKISKEDKRKTLISGEERIYLVLINYYMHLLALNLVLYCFLIYFLEFLKSFC